MKKIFVYVVLIMVLMPLCIQAKKVAVLDGLLRPDSIKTGGDRIYITEGASIYVYSLKDYRLIKKFGKAGEGPQEFKIPPMRVLPYNDKVYVNSSGKLSIFTRDGQFIKEFKVMPLLSFTPFLDKYLVRGSRLDKKGGLFVSIDFYNERFEKIKELYVFNMSKTFGPTANLNLPTKSYAFPAYKDKIYVVAGKEGFVIDVLDKDGNKLYRIKKDYKPLPVDEEYKEKTLNWLKAKSRDKKFWEFLKDKISFKTHFPAIKNLIPVDDRLYVLTYKMKNDDFECIVLDLKGNEQKRVFVPCPGIEPKYAIYGRAFYLLKENEEEETWELHKTDL